MYYELYADVDPSQGGVWFDPERWTYVEVIDLDSAAGVDGTVLIAEGGAYIDEEGIRGGARSMGMPEPVIERAVRDFKVWIDEYEFNFEDAPSAVKHGALIAAEASFAYRKFDGPADKQVIVVHEDHAETAEDVADQWGAREAVTTPDLEQAVRTVLEVDFDIVLGRTPGGGRGRHGWRPKR